MIPAGDSMTQHTKGEAVARVLFVVFAHVADCKQRIEPQDIEQLHQLLADVSWAKNIHLRAGLESLRDNYASFWTDYEGGKLVASLEAARLRLAVAMIGMKPEHAAAFTQSMLEFTRRALPVGPGALSMLGLASSAERRRARKDMDDLLSAGPEAIRAATSPGSSQGPGAPPQEGSAKGVASPSPSPSAAATEQAPEGAAAAASDAAASDAAAAPGPFTGWPAPAGVEWKGGRFQAVCVRVADETHDVKTYTFVADPPRRFSYRPGQFVTIDLPVDGASCRRSYTMSSSPSRPDAISITVKRVPGGLASNWLYEHASPGMAVRMNGPYGQFSCLEHPSRKLLLVSGGSGVTPMMSMLRWLGDTATRADIVFINNVRTPADVIFEQELACLSVQLGNALKVAVVPSAHAPFRPWNGPMGRLERGLLLTLAPDFMERETFVCGPAPYMDAVRSTLLELGYPMPRFHQESFGAAPAAPEKAEASSAPPPSAPRPIPVPPVRAAAPILLPSPPKGAGRDAPKGAQVRFQNKDVTIACDDDETLLEAAERAHIALDASCRSGRCGTCRLKKVSGEVAMDGQEALTESDIESGYILACVGRPRGLVVVQG
jgi:ferredoxin-NADP reductase